jgi:hypothetical protein
MKILELFSGTECLSDAFRARGHECFTVDWDTRFPSSLHIDIMQLTAQRILTDFGRPDIIWAGCDCTTFSVAAIGHHRRKDPATGSLAPKTEKAARADEVNRHTLGIIRSLRPRFFFIENPMGGLRKMDYMRGIPRKLTRIYSKMTKKTMKSLLVSTLLLIFAASNQISDPKSLLHRGSVFCGHLTSLVENSHAPQGADYILGGNRVGYWKQPKVSANLNLTARSAAVLLLSNVKSN